MANNIVNYALYLNEQPEIGKDGIDISETEFNSTANIVYKRLQAKTNYLMGDVYDYSLNPVPANPKLYRTAKQIQAIRDANILQIHFELEQGNKTGTGNGLSYSEQGISLSQDFNQDKTIADGVLELLFYAEVYKSFNPKKTNDCECCDDNVFTGEQIGNNRCVRMQDLQNYTKNNGYDMQMANWVYALDKYGYARFTNPENVLKLDNYYTKSEADALLNLKATVSQLNIVNAKVEDLYFSKANESEMLDAQADIFLLQNDKANKDLTNITWSNLLDAQTGNELTLGANGKLFYKMPNIGFEIFGPYNSLNDVPTPYKTNGIYLIGTAAPYEEYIRINNNTDWEDIGSASTDLSDYYTKTEVDTKFNGYYTMPKTNELLDGKINLPLDNLNYQNLNLTSTDNTVEITKNTTGINLAAKTTGQMMVKKVTKAYTITDGTLNAIFNDLQSLQPNYFNITWDTTPFVENITVREVIQGETSTNNVPLPSSLTWYKQQANIYDKTTYTAELNDNTNLLTHTFGLKATVQFTGGYSLFVINGATGMQGRSDVMFNYFGTATVLNPLTNEITVDYYIEEQLPPTPISETPVSFLRIDSYRNENAQENTTENIYTNYEGNFSDGTYFAFSFCHYWILKGAMETVKPRIWFTFLTERVGKLVKIKVLHRVETYNNSSPSTYSGVNYAYLQINFRSLPTFTKNGVSKSPTTFTRTLGAAKTISYFNNRLCNFSIYLDKDYEDYPAWSNYYGYYAARWNIVSSRNDSSVLVDGLEANWDFVVEIPDFEGVPSTKMDEHHEIKNFSVIDGKVVEIK